LQDDYPEGRRHEHTELLLARDARRASAPEATLPQWAIFWKHAKPMKFIQIENDLKPYHRQIATRIFIRQEFLRRWYVLGLPLPSIS
jgi:hypothetical protein